MGIRIPAAITSLNEATGSTTSLFFTVPQDVSAVTLKLYGTLTGTSPTCDVSIRTTDDGGTTSYVVGAFAQMTGTISSANALWMTIPVDGTCVTAGGNGYIGAAASATASQMTGLPLLNKRVKVTFTYGGTVGAASINVNVLANQSSRN